METNQNVDKNPMVPVKRKKIKARRKVYPKYRIVDAAPSIESCMD